MKADAHVFVGLVQNGKVHLDFPKQFNAYAQRFEGDEVELQIRKRRVTRSLKQNAALHACLSRWALECGHNVEELKDDLLALEFGYIVRQNKFTGEVIKALVKPHTSKLNSKEFTDLFDLAAIEAAEEGHVMTMPDEYKKAKEAAAKKAERDRKKAEKGRAA